MSGTNLFIHGIGHFHPENVIDNAFLEALAIDTSDAWIVERTGIRSRRTVLSLDYIRKTRNARPPEAECVYNNAQTGELAARMALARAGIEPKDIGLVIGGGCAPQYTSPADACTVAARLGLSGPAQVYDLCSACSTYAIQLHHLRCMREDMLPDFVLILNPENNTRAVNYNDRSSAILWGDCSTATVVSPRVPSPWTIRFTHAESDPSGWDKVVIPNGGHFSQDGPAVQAFAIRKSVNTLSLLREKAARPEGIHFIGHQANLTMLKSVAERGKIAADRHLFNVDRFGNCGSAGAPSVLSENWDRFSKGDEIVIAVAGSGLTWGGALIERTS